MSPCRYKQINQRGLGKHPNQIHKLSLFLPARAFMLVPLDDFDPETEKIGTNEMRCRQRHAYSDHEDKSELGSQILARRKASPPAAQPRSRRSTGKAARVMKTHPIPRHSYWSGIAGEPLVLITATQDTIFNKPKDSPNRFNPKQAIRLRTRVCRPQTDMTSPFCR